MCNLTYILIVSLFCKIVLGQTSSKTVSSRHEKSKYHPYDKLCRLGKTLSHITTDSRGRPKLQFLEPMLVHQKHEMTKALAMCVINQRNGVVIFYNKFELYELWAAWMDLNRHLENIAPERIVILQAEGQSILGLRNATQFISSLGSVFAEHLIPETIWTWAFVMGGKTIFERYSSSIHVKRNQNTSSHSIIQLSDNLYPNYQYNTFDKRRWKFCSKYGVMGDLCDESVRLNSSHFETQNDDIESILKSIPVIITAGKRTSYLYQSLKSYLRATEAVKSNFHVMMGTYFPQTIELLTLLNIRYKYIPPSQYENYDFFPFLYYKEVFQYAYDNFQNVTYVIFLEEDIEVSLDFFNYIKQTVHLLKKDPTLYCITGFSALGLKFLAHDESVLLRGDVQVGWGYALSRKFIYEALLTWPTTVVKASMYDAYLYQLKEDRECVLPEVSRSKHFGIGMNTDYFSTEKTFLNMPITKSKKVTLSPQYINSLELASYNKELRRKLSHATPISNNVCKEGFLDKINPGSYVIYYNFTYQTKNITYKNFYVLGNCFRAWVYSFQGQHDYVNTVKLSRNITFYLVAHPQSSFSDMKPEKYIPYDVESLKLTSKENYEIYAKKSLEAQELAYMKYKVVTNRYMRKLFL